MENFPVFLLPLKSIFFHERPVGTLLFDEVDAGVGGETAHIIGKRLKSLAEKSQVLVVTHLPQLASLAEHHFCISKEHSEGRTYAKNSLRSWRRTPTRNVSYAWW